MPSSTPVSQAPPGLPPDLASDLPPLFFKLAVGALFVGCGVYLVLVWAYTPEQWWRAVAPVVGLALAVVSGVLVWRGRAWAGMRVSTLGAWVLITVPSFFLGGVHTPVIIAYPVLLLLMAWLFSPRVSGWVLGLSMGALAAMGLGEVQGWLPAPPPTPTVLYLASQLLMLGLTGLMASFVVGAYRRQWRAIDEGRRLAVQRSRGLAQREQELAEAHDRLQSIFENNPDVLMISRMSDGCITDVNAAALRLFGYMRDEVLGQTTLGLGLWVQPADRERLAQVLRLHGYCEGLVSEFRLRSGATIVASLTAVITRLKGEPCVISTLHDITQRQRAEERLQASEALLRSTLESIDEGVLLVDAQEEVLSCNQRFLELWQCPQGAPVPGLRALVVQHSDRLVEPLAALVAVEQALQRTQASSGTLCFADGREWTWFTRVFDGPSRTAVRIWCCRDISAQAQAQREVQQRERYQRALLDNFPFLVWLKDRNGRFLAVNRAMARLHGVGDPQTLNGRSDFDLFGTQRALAYREDDRAVLESGLPSQGEEMVEEAGRRLWRETYKSPVVVEGEVIGTVGFARDITARKLLLEQVQTSQSLLRRIIHALPDLVWLKDPQGVYLACNRRFEAFFGQTEDKIIHKTDYDYVDKELADFFRENDRLAVLQGSARRNEEWVTFASDGHQELLETTKTPIFGDDGALIGVLGVGHDITARRRAEDALRLSASVFSHAREAIVITDARGVVIDVNAAFTRITGFERAQMLEQPIAMLHSGNQGQEQYGRMSQALLSQGHWEGEVWMRRHSGEVFAVLESASAVHGPDGGIEHFVAMFSDITSQKKSQRRLERIAHYDALTDLPNRVLFSDRLQQAMASAVRHQRPMALVFVDLDGFKAVNDRHGHAAGDLLLVRLAARMRRCVREGDTVARLGGDEFVAVLVDLATVQAAQPLLERLLHSLSQPVQWSDGVSLQVSASMGVVLYLHQAATATSAQELMLLADAAMYRAKMAGKNRFVVVDSVDAQQLNHRS
ncbi:MAG: PAS domain S-box protein [Rhodoferax sp.]